MCVCVNVICDWTSICDRTPPHPFVVVVAVVVVVARFCMCLLFAINQDPARHSVDFTRESDDDRTDRFIDSLKILKFRFPSEDMERYRISLKKGERVVVYPILYWALSKFKDHAKRAYLSRFLMKNDIPQDYLQDEALAHAVQQLTSLQGIVF